MNQKQQIEWRGDEKMIEKADETYKEMVKLFQGMTTEELSGVNKLMSFWKNNIMAGHKNIFKMAPVAIEDAVSTAEDDGGP